MRNILLVDFSSVLHPIWHMESNNPDPNATSTKVVERIRALASGQPFVAICCDKGPYFRKQIDENYKSTRPEVNAPLLHQGDVALDVLRADGFPVWEFAGYEADDLLGAAVFHAEMLNSRSGQETVNITIASADKDILQLVSDRVSVKSLKDGSIIGPDEVKAKLGVWPHQVVDYLSLVGDASDNIKGAEKIGPKRASEILETFGNLEDAYRALDGGQDVLTPSVTQSLKDFGVRLTTVRDLIRLRTDAPIAFEEIFKERVPTDVAVFGGQEMSDEHTGELREDAREAPAAAPADRPEPPNEPAAVVREARTPDLQRDGPDATRAGSDQGRPTVAELFRQAEITARTDAERARALIPREPDIISAAPVEWERQLEPRSIAQAKQVAADLFASRMFSAYGNAPAVLSTIMAGRELGFQTMASLRAFHVIEGKPSLSAGAIHSLVLTSGKAKYFRCTERTAERATFETQRGDDPPMSLTFTIAEARAAWSKDEKAWAASGWGKNPADMLVARALTKLARLVYPDITHGLYATEELS